MKQVCTEKTRSSHFSLYQSQVSAPGQTNGGGSNGTNGNVPPNNGQLLTLEEDEDER